MTKTTAIKIFGSRKALAKAVDKNPTWVTRLPEELTLHQRQLIVGAAYLLKLQLPKMEHLQ